MEGVLLGTECPRGMELEWNKEIEKLKLQDIEIIQLMKNKKSAGTDKISAELIKHEVYQLHKDIGSNREDVGTGGNAP